MKIIPNIFISLAILFALSYQTCDGQYLEIIKGVGIAIKMVIKAQSILEPYINPENETVDENELLNEKIDDISFQLQQMKTTEAKNFKALLERAENTPNKTMSLIVASELETAIIHMRNELEDIAHIALKVKNGSLVRDEYNLNKLKNFSNNIDRYRKTIRSIVGKRDISMDYLSFIKSNITNVCSDKMTQLQVLDSFRSLYVETILKYLVSEHLIISMYEKLGTPDPNNGKKIALNEKVQKDFNGDLSRFKKIMADASREYQTCTKPSLFYETGLPYRKKGCYIIDPNNKYQPSTGSLTSLQVDRTVCWYYFSLRPANAKPGYVVLGAKIARQSNILYIRVIQGKLLPNGLIDAKTISYNEDTEHGVGDRVVKIHYRSNRHETTVIDLTETIAPNNRVITGLKFALSEKGHVYLDVTSTKVDLKEGLLYQNTTRSEKHENGELPYTVKTANNPVARSPIGLQAVKPKQHVKLIINRGAGAHPYIDGDVIFPTPLTLLSGASLYVKEIEGELGFLSLRLHTFNVVPHIGINLDVNQNFNDVLERL